jgi:hypothetical protein
MEELPDHWKESIIVLTRMGRNLTAVIMVGYHWYQFHIKFCPISSQG